MKNGGVEARRTRPNQFLWTSGSDDKKGMCRGGEIPEKRR